MPRRGHHLNVALSRILDWATPPIPPREPLAKDTPYRPTALGGPTGFSSLVLIRCFLACLLALPLVVYALHDTNLEALKVLFISLSSDEDTREDTQREHTAEDTQQEDTQQEDQARNNPTETPQKVSNKSSPKLLSSPRGTLVFSPMFSRLLCLTQ